MKDKAGKAHLKFTGWIFSLNRCVRGKQNVHGHPAGQSTAFSQLDYLPSWRARSPDSVDAQLTQKLCSAGKGTAPIPPRCAVVKEELMRFLETILPQSKLRFWGGSEKPQRWANKSRANRKSEKPII